MSAPEATPPGEDQLLKEAAAWFARMRGPEADASRVGFEAWLARGALHRRAYNRAAEIFAMGKLLGEEDVPARSPDRGQRQSRRRLVLATMAALLALAMASWLALRTVVNNRDPTDRITQEWRQERSEVARLATGPAHTRTFRMSDGSLVRLESNTTIDVAFDRTVRRLTPERGTARFQVAHEARAFMVHAGGGLVTARGTVFDVGMGQDRRVTVRLVEGVVDVTPPSQGRASRPAPRRLRAGETISYVAQGEVAREPSQPGSGSPPSDSSIGRLEAVREFDRVTVAELIAIANRNASRPIRLSEPALGLRRISGRFRIDDAALLAERIAALFDLEIDDTDPAEIVLRPR